MKLKNMYWQIIDFQKTLGARKGYAEIATDPSMLQKISDGEISQAELKNVTNPMETINRLDNDMSREAEIDALIRSQDEGDEVGVPTLGNKGYADNVVTAVARTADDLDDTGRARLILEEMLAVISDIQKDMREQLTRNIPKNQLGEGVSVKLGKDLSLIHI